MVNIEKYHSLLQEFSKTTTKLVAVSKLKSVADIKALYDLGQRDFGENYVQELVEKEALLPKDIRWHFIGHLQTNKVKYIAPFIYLIQSADTEKLLKEINKQAEKNKRIILCLLQVHISSEETKFGFDEKEIAQINFSEYPHILFSGLMGMASFTADKQKVQREFQSLRKLSGNFEPAIRNPQSETILSMGMSDDFQLAVKEGSNMVRIGSLLFGKR